MAESNSVLGPLSDRVKEDIRVPKALRDMVEKMSEKLGVPKNAFYVISASLFAVRLVQMGATSGRSREALLDAIEGELRDILREARRIAS